MAEEFNIEADPQTKVWPRIVLHRYLCFVKTIYDSEWTKWIQVNEINGIIFAVRSNLSYCFLSLKVEQTGSNSNPWTLRYRCVAFSTVLCYEASYSYSTPTENGRCW